MLGYSYISNEETHKKEEFIKSNQYEQRHFPSPEEIKSRVIFTDYNTIKSDYFGELTIEDFFNKFEKDIKDRKIINCNLDLINNKLTFEVKETKRTYNILIDEEEYEKIKTGIPNRNTRVLLVLFDLENELSQKDNEKLKEERINKRLLSEAKNGNIQNKRAKDLYIKELKQELKKKYHVLKNTKEESKNNIENNTNIISRLWKKCDTGVAERLGIFLCSLTSSIIFGLGYFYSGEIGLKMPLIIILSISILVGYPFALKLANNIGIYIKTLISELKKVYNDKKLIKHKIKTLQNMRVPEEITHTNSKDKKENKIKQETINEKIKRLSILIGSLSQDNKIKMSEVLLSKIENYQTRLNEAKDELLVLETEEMIKRNYIIELDKFETEIELLIEQEKELTELNRTIDFLEKMKTPSNKENSEEKLTELNSTIELLKEMKYLLNNNQKNATSSKEESGKLLIKRQN